MYNCKYFSFMEEIKIPFNKPYIIGKELYYIALAVLSGKISGDGCFTKKCCELLEQRYSARKILLTTSCSAALDISSILTEVKNEDEVILPSYTFTSTANPFLSRGAKIVFADIRQDNLNIDEESVKSLITEKTRVIVPVHYAGVSCEMDAIKELSARYNIIIVEDAAQGMDSRYKDKYLGTIGDIGCYSFHETKNFTCGEGGAIVINNPAFIERAEIIREKGTNRSKFFRGEVDKYTWVDEGSSFLPSELLSAFLYAQLENADLIINRRLNSWNYYYSAFRELEQLQLLRRPIILNDCIHNGHLFYILLNDMKTRDDLMNYLKSRGILAIFHYLPLHLSPIGHKLGYRKGMLPVTENLAEKLLRLPLFFDITFEQQDFIIENIYSFFKKNF